MKASWFCQKEDTGYIAVHLGPDKPLERWQFHVSDSISFYEFYFNFKYLVNYDEENKGRKHVC